MALRVIDGNRSGSGLGGDWVRDQRHVVSTLARSGLSASHMSVVCLQRHQYQDSRHRSWSSGSRSSSCTDMTDIGTSRSSTEIPILVAGTLKWVTGLTRRTTCDDVIYALLRNRGHEHVDVSTYTIWERWREVERPLRGRTKIYKVWRAWGTESCNVQFYLRRLENALDACRGEVVVKSKPSRKLHRRHSHRTSHHDVICEQHQEEVRPRRSRSRPGHSRHRVSRSHPTSRSLSPVKPRQPPPIPARAPRQQAADVSPMYQQLIQIILEQERRIQEQSLRIQQTDAQIETYESRMHQLRMQANGRDYVQNAYLCGTANNEDTQGHPDVQGHPDQDTPAAEIQSYLRRLSVLQDQLAQEEDKIQDLSMKVMEESFVLEPPDVSFSHVCNNDSINVDWDADSEVEVLREEIHRCMNISSSQQTDLDLVDRRLEECEEELRIKRSHIEELCRDLQLKKSALTEGLLAEDDDRDSGLSSPGSVDTSPTTTTTTIPSQIYMEHSKFLVSQYRDWTSGLTTIPESPQREPPLPGDKLRELNDRITSSQTLHRDSEHRGNSLQPYCTHTNFDWKEGQLTLGGNTVRGSVTVQVEDDNSDTGLSSMHSDEPPPVLETLV